MMYAAVGESRRAAMRSAALKATKAPRWPRPFFGAVLEFLRLSRGAVHEGGGFGAGEPRTLAHSPMRQRRRGAAMVELLVLNPHLPVRGVVHLCQALDGASVDAYLRALESVRHATA
jgi:hypothetical protein